MDWSISGLISLGTMILVPQVMRPDLMDSISLCGSNSWRSVSRFVLLQGNPVLI